MKLFYDLEIAKLINFDSRYPNLQYCDGWDDFKGMGISCVGFALNYDDAIAEPYPSERFIEMATSGDYEVIGFNSNSFDDQLLRANGINIQSTDLLSMIRLVAYGSTNWEDQPRGYSYKLDSLARANGIPPKTGTGELAPVLWQLGKHQQVLDYCAHDVDILRKLYHQFITVGIFDPNTSELLRWGGDK